MFNRLFDNRRQARRPLMSSQHANGPSSTEHSNPAYQRHSASINTHKPNSGTNTDDIELFDFEEIEKALEEIDKVKQSKDLDIATLSGYKRNATTRTLWRQGPAPIEEATQEITKMKIGSLQSNEITQIKDVDRQKLISNMNNDEATSALLTYFAEIGASRESTQVDYDFLEQLLITADINVRDVHGQSLMHEVAREWSTDLADYLLLRGVDIDHPDNFGRTPLFVAVASNYVEMASWLIDNGADIHHITITNECQMPIHFAAKYDSVECFDLLVECSADPVAEDGLHQTPMFLAAANGQNRMVQHLLSLGYPTTTVNRSGILCIELIVENLPTDTAWEALNDYMKIDKVNRQEIYYMMNFSRSHLRSDMAAHRFPPPNILEIMVDSNDLSLVVHPVTLQFINLKGKLFATKYLRLNVLLYLVFTLVWTASISIRETNTHGWTYKVGLIIVLTIFGQILSFHFVWKMFKEFHSSWQSKEREKRRVRNEIKERSKYAHPRWEIEKRLLDKELETSERQSTNYWSNGWNIIEALCLALTFVQFIITMVWIGRPSTSRIHEIRIYYSAVFIVLVWIRLNNCFHYSQTVGAFVAMLGECVIAVARFGFLFLEFFIPFTCSFWVLFGGKRKALVGNDDAGGEYKEFNNLVYQMYLLTIVGDYDYNDLSIVNRVFAEIFVSLYFILVSVITLNLFIALMSEAIARVNEKASAQAYLKEAEEINLIDKYFTGYRDDFESYLRKECNPLKIKDEKRRGEKKIENKDRKLLQMVRQLSLSVHETTKEIRETKKTMDMLCDMLNEFKTVSPEDRTTEYRIALKKTSEFYSSYFNRMQRKTLYKMSDMIDEALTARKFES